MSHRYKAKRRRRYLIQRKKCQRCGAPGEVYTLEDFMTGVTVCVEVYCPDHASQAGYCRGCGHFWGGICSFETNQNGLCDHCQADLDADFGNHLEDDIDSSSFFDDDVDRLP